MKKIKRKLTFWDFLYWGLALVPFVISILFYRRLPEQVVTQWGSDNQPSGYSSRNMAAFGIPAFMFLMAVIVNAIQFIDPKRENIMRSKEVMAVVRWFIVLLAVLMQFVIVLSAVGVSVNVGTVVSLPIALVFIVLGNYLPRCRQNYTLGIKLPWTLADEENWTRTHRLAGYVWTVGGVLMIVMGFFHMESLYFLVFISVVLIPAVYSYCIYRKKTGHQ